MPGDMPGDMPTIIPGTTKTPPDADASGGVSHAV